MGLNVNSISLASGLKIPVSSTNTLLNNGERVEVHKTPLNPESRTPTTGDAVPEVEGSTSKDPSTSSLPSRKEDADHGGKMADEDHMETGLDLSFVMGLDEEQSSESSDDEQLPSLQEMMQSAAKQPNTQEKTAFPEPVLPRQHAIPSNVSCITHWCYATAVKLLGSTVNKEMFEG